MISKLSIRNFKCLRDVHVGLERFTVFVGPNASGKSSILQSTELLCRAFHGSYGTNIEIETSDARSRGTKSPVELAAESSGKWFRFRSRSVSELQNPGFGQLSTSDGFAADIFPTPDAKSWTSWALEPETQSPLPLAVLLRLEASKLVQPVPAQPDFTVMAPDGTGLHFALASMALNDPDSWQALQENLKRIIPTIRRLRHTKTQPTSLLFDTVGADSLPATQVSEGTLLVLGLLTAFHSSGRPNLVLLDDIDRGLHPKAQKELITLLRGLLDTNPDLQIVATTHSPYMLDWMEVNEVRMMFLKDDGSSVCASLTSHPKYPKWKDEMTPGEMWSLFGEKWVAEQEVAA